MWRGCHVKDEEMSEFPKYPNFLKIILEKTTGNVFIWVVDVLMYVVLSMAERHVTYGDLFGNNRIKLYLFQTIYTSVVLHL